MATGQQLLQEYQRVEYGEVKRSRSAYNPLYSYRLPRGDHKQYTQQFGDIYFLRLSKLKPVVEKVAENEWNDFAIAGEKAQRVDRVLDVRQGLLCWVVGTVYMEMPLKPNILDDISKEHWVAGPPPRKSYFSVDGGTQVMLEDESGRLRLSGDMLKQNLLVTGVIVAVLGTENANGDFDVLDILIPELPPQPARWQRDDEEQEQDDGMKIERTPDSGKKIAFVSGLDISGTNADTLNLSLLSEYLLGEALDEDDQNTASRISRLVIVGNSIAPDVIIDKTAVEDTKKPVAKKYGYDAASYNPAPTTQLDHFLAELLPSIPITIMAGEQDPANTSLPQQAIHPAMFPQARAYATANVAEPEEEEPGWFETVTNPWDGDIEGWRMLGNSGQPVDDILKYVELGGPDGQGAEGRLEVMESMLRWRCCAPTAPDTLWCYPFQERDQFVIEHCPHVFFVGNQPRFDTLVIEGPAGQRVRLITIPKFTTGEIVLLDTETLEVELNAKDPRIRTMLINEHVAIYTNRVVLVPYCRRHVATYHDWMKDPVRIRLKVDSSEINEIQDIQVATASEPLSLTDEYSMQQSWRLDSDKLTFILCKVPSRGEHSLDHAAEIILMAGDVNMFMSMHEEEDGTLSLVGELEIMVASKTDQGKGLGRSALLTFLLYVLKHEEQIAGQYHDQSLAASKSMRLDYFVVKVNEQNGRSLALFEKMGFKKTSEAPNFFGEYEMRLNGLSVAAVTKMLSENEVDNYREVAYEHQSEIDGRL